MRHAGWTKMKFLAGILVLVYLLMVAGMPPAALAGQSSIAEVTVTGQGLTTKLALRDAFRQAIEQRLGVLVSGRTVLADFAVVADKLAASSQGFIEGYELLADQVDSQGLHTVTALVRISSDSAVNRQLMMAAGVEEGNADATANRALIQVNLNDPRVAINFLNEPWADSRLINMFKAAGFSRVLQGAFGDMRVRGFFDQLRCQPCRSWGFVGDYTASATCHVIIPENAGCRAFDSVRTASAWSTNGREAVQLAKERALELVVADLDAWLKDRVRSTEQHVRVFVYLQPAEAQAWLESLPLVNQVYVRKVDAYGCITLDADTDCSALELATTITAMGGKAKEVGGDVFVVYVKKPA